MNQGSVFNNAPADASAMLAPSPQTPAMAYAPVSSPTVGNIPMATPPPTPNSSIPAAPPYPGFSPSFVGLHPPAAPMATPGVGANLGPASGVPTMALPSHTLTQQAGNTAANVAATNLLRRQLAQGNNAPPMAAANALSSPAVAFPNLVDGLFQLYGPNAPF